MKQWKLFSGLLMATCASTFAVGCGDSNSDAPSPDAQVAPKADANPTDPAGGNVDVPGGDLSGDVLWKAKNTYILKGQVFFISGTLTIEPGTVIKGEPGSVLAITKSAKINAVGTDMKPIVFTSAGATPKSGDWGGVVLLGKAPINVTGGSNKVEGFPDTVGDKISYGGTEAGHDCGKLKYARIEYAGFQLSPDNELNGLTLGGCGNATTVDYVQVHLGLDDGIEVFGGTTNLSHIVISQPDDDGLDWDLGWSGKIQFLVVQQRTGRGDRGIEADNNKNNNDALPRSSPEVWNATLIGGDGLATDKQGGMHLRRGTAAKISNVVMTGFTSYAIDVDGAATVAQATSGALSISNTYFVKATNSDLWPANFDVVSGKENDCDGTGANCFNEATVLGAGTNKIGIDPMLAAPRNMTAPSWKPMAGAPVLTGCGTPSAGLDQTATFCGAIGPLDWTQGWTRFPS
jgi:hypothetical protein